MVETKKIKTMKHIKRFYERADINLAEQIAKDLLPKLTNQRNNGESIRFDNFEKYMKDHGADLSMTDAVISELVNLGFDFDTEDE